MLLLPFPLFLMLIFVRWLVAIVTKPTLFLISAYRLNLHCGSQKQMLRNTVLVRTTVKLVGTR